MSWNGPPRSNYVSTSCWQRASRPGCRRPTSSSEVLWRLPIAVRIGMLEDLLERHGLTDRWPFIVPVLRSFFDLRNTLAHGLTFTGLTPDGPTPGGVRITTLKRGRGVTVSYPMERLEWLAWQARVVDVNHSSWSHSMPPIEQRRSGPGYVALDRPSRRSDRRDECVDCRRSCMARTAPSHDGRRA